MQDQIITVKEARKFLGKDGKELSDEDIQKLITEFSAIARLHIQMVPKTV